MIKDALSNTYDKDVLEPGPDENAKVVLNGMQRLQHVHDQRVYHESIHMLLQRNEEMFTYPNFAEDKDNALTLFIKFEDREAEEIFQLIREKQQAYDDARRPDSLSRELTMTEEMPIIRREESPSSYSPDSPRDVIQGIEIITQSQSITHDYHLISAEAHDTTTISARETRRRIENQRGIKKVDAAIRTRAGGENKQNIERPYTHRGKIKEGGIKASARETLRRIERVRSGNNIQRSKRGDGMKTGDEEMILSGDGESN